MDALSRNEGEFFRKLVEKVKTDSEKKGITIISNKIMYGR